LFLKSVSTLEKVTNHWKTLWETTLWYSQSS